MHRRATTTCFFAIAALALMAATGQAVAADTKPADTSKPLRLVLQITVDQLRGEQLEAHSARFGPNGFRRLLDSGAVYTNAHYIHANTETIVGHSTLATGATPSAHGMVGNVWYDRSAGRVVYNIEDDRYQLLGDAPRSAGELLGPESVAKAKGRSPASLLASTLSDKLGAATGGRSRSFAVALKDRAAVPMAGRSGKAIWFSKRSGHFVSSTYYFANAPSWLVSWNAGKPFARYAQTQWSLTAPRASYVFAEQDDRAYESMLHVFGKTFPHAYESASGPMFTNRLVASPAGDELVGALSASVIDSAELGRRDVVDYLAVGFSATDYIGHTFGPNSLEAEDNLLRLDATLATLLAAVDEKIGLDATLVVLSSDHGVAEAPESRATRGLESERLYLDSLDGTALRERIAARFGVGDLVVGYTHPYLHLRRDRIAAQQLALAEVQRFAAEQLSAVDGVERAIAAADIAITPTSTRVQQQVAANHHRKRSGDVYVVPKSHALPYRGGRARPLTATHGTPWPYDTHVPIIFMGPRIAAARIERAVAPRDVAPTIAAYLEIDPPDSASGTPLVEVLGKQKQD